MEREIKFRAWNIEESRMIQDIQLEYDSFIDVEDTFAEYIEQESGYSRIGEKGKYHVMQYTGLKDKNGKEVYDGDIVSICRSGFVSGNFEDIICSVYFDNLNCQFKMKQKETYLDNGDFDEDYGCYSEYVMSFPTVIEIIGNIHQNPELLTQQKTIQTKNK